MTGPFQSRKQAVDLAAPVVRVSLIRRDPPPPVKKVSHGEIKEQEGRAVVIGILVFGLALFIILIGFINAAGWTPNQYTIEVRQSS